MLITKELAEKIIKKRDVNSHKGDFGWLSIVAGCSRFSGAAILSCRAALRAGSGLVTLCSTDSVCDRSVTSVPEVILCRLDSDKEGAISEESAKTVLSLKSTAMVIGCGLSLAYGAKQVVKELVTSSLVPLLLDADGLNAVSENPHILLNAKAPVIITPHAGEMSRLTGLSTDEIEKKREKTALDFSLKYKVITVLKGHKTLIAAPDGTLYENTTGNPGMATGGSGDVLAGILGSFLAQGYSPLQSAICGVFLHGLAGDLAKEELGEYSLLPSDIVNFLPKAFIETAKDKVK